MRKKIRMAFKFIGYLILFLLFSFIWIFIYYTYILSEEDKTQCYKLSEKDARFKVDKHLRLTSDPEHKASSIETKNLYRGLNFVRSKSIWSKNEREGDITLYYYNERLEQGYYFQIYEDCDRTSGPSKNAIKEN